MEILLASFSGFTAPAEPVRLHQETVPLIAVYSVSERHRVRYCVSPDGKYVARLTLEADAEVGELAYLRIYHKSSVSRMAPAKPALVASAVEGFDWVPLRAHTLAFSSDGGHYGRGLLALWTPEKGKRFLLRGKELADDNFALTQMAADGSALYYKHFGNDVNRGHADYGRGLHRMRLPSL